MKKIKNFKDFINENIEIDEFETIQPDSDIDTEDVFFDGDDDKTEFKSEIETDSEDEEIDDLLEIVYNQKTDSWDDIGELDLPTDFESFQEWFMEEISDDDTTTASMKEEGDEIVFHIPEDLYIVYLDSQKGYKDELDNISQEEDMDDDDFDDEENLPF